jgi:hypothetical protein
VLNAINAAIQCNGMLPRAGDDRGEQNLIQRRRHAGPRLRFGQDDVRFELKGVRCGLPTIRAVYAVELKVQHAHLQDKYRALHDGTLGHPTSKAGGDFD